VGRDGLWRFVAVVPESEGSVAGIVAVGRGRERGHNTYLAV
jgi:hypothetical protein